MPHDPSAMKRSTINDVAQKAGVSKATVSHVLNNTRFVEEPTKNRVLQAIQEIGYRPSNVARSLTTNQTNTIGVVISDASNYFFGEILRGLEDILRPQRVRPGGMQHGRNPAARSRVPRLPPAPARGRDHRRGHQPALGCALPHGHAAHPGGLYGPHLRGPGRAFRRRQ